MNNPETLKSELIKALQQLGVHDHLCLIYESREEQLASAIPFIKMGLERNEQCVYIVDENTAQTVLDAMRAEGIDTDSAVESGALKVITKREAYLMRGYFDPDLMIQFLKEGVNSAKRAGFKALRVTGEMTWALGSETGVERLVEYEAKLNYIIPEYDILAICQYNRNRFKPEIIIDIIRTHPLVIYGSIVCKNFYYVPPDEFLKPKEQQISMEVARLLKNVMDYERAEEKLREASQYTRSLIEVSLDPLVTIGRNGKIMDVNQATELATGLPREKLIGSDFSDYFTEPDKAREGYGQVFERGFVRDYPLAIQHTSGRTMDVLYNAAVYKNEAGDVQGVFAAARDITERRRAEEMRSMLASIVEYSEDAIIGKTLDGIIFSWNPGAEKVYGYSANEVIGKPVSILIPPDHFDEMPKILERIKQGETIEHYEAIRLKKDGRHIDIALTVSPIKDAEGRITGASTIAHDITEHKKIERQLHEASLYARNLIETSLDPLVTISPEGKITDVNKATELVTGDSREKLIGSDFSDYFTEPEKAREGYEEVFEKGFVKDYPLAIRHVSGSITDVLYNASVYRDAAGNVAGVFAAARDVTERKRAEEKLHEASLYTRSLIEVSLDPLVTISPDGKITDVNTATEQVTGVSRELLVGSDFSNYFTEPEKAKEGYKQVFEKGFVKDYPLAIRHTSGKVTDVLYNASVYKNKAGEVLGVFAAARDITERMRAEEKLLEASLYTRSLIEVSLDPLVTISKDGKITDVNTATESVTGVSREKLIGSDFSDYFTEPDRAREGYRQVFERGFVRDYPLAIRHVSGSTVDVLYNAAVYKDAAGNVAGVFAAARDITERKRSEEKLREASLYTRSLIEVSLDPLVTIGREGKIMDVNQATELATGLPREKLIGSDFSEYFTEPEKAREGYQQVFEKGFVKNYPLAIRHVSGSTVDVLYNAAVYKDAAGNVTGVFAAARDITERMRAEEALRKAHNELEIRVKERTSELSSSLREKETLLKEVHHRVKNNLQIVSSILQLQSTYMKDEDAIVAFREGRNRVYTLALIHEKLYRSKDLAKINFAEYIEELTSSIYISFSVNAEQIKLNIKVADVFFDINTAIPCGLIINELITNSIKHAFPEGKKGEINILLQPVEGKFVLIISDDGAGFPKDMDFRNTETLGLKLVTSLAKQLDGTIELDRSAGTKFEITFSEMKYKERG